MIGIHYQRLTSVLLSEREPYALLWKHRTVLWILLTFELIRNWTSDKLCFYIRLDSWLWELTVAGSGCVVIQSLGEALIFIFCRLALSYENELPLILYRTHCALLTTDLYCDNSNFKSLDTRLKPGPSSSVSSRIFLPILTKF